MTAAPTVHLVGAGPGDPMLLTRRAARLLAEADVVVIDRRSLDAIAALAPPTAERVFVGRADGRPAWDTDAVADLLADRARFERARTDNNGGVLAHSAAGTGMARVERAETNKNGGVLAHSAAGTGMTRVECAETDNNGEVPARSKPAAGATSVECAETDGTEAVPPRSTAGAAQAAHRPTVVRLKSGDPFVCSRGGEEMAALVARGVHVEVTPGVSAATAAPLAAGVARGRTVTILAGNDDPVYPVTDIAALADPDSSLVVLVGRARQQRLADTLIAAGLDPATPAAVVHAATRPGARIVHTTLEHLGDHRLPPPATVVIGPARAHP